MADADNKRRINIWRNSTIAASAATVEPGTHAFGRMSIYRTEALARSHRHHEVPAGGGGDYTASAVHFDGSAWLGCNSLVATDNGLLSFVFWEKIAAADYSAATILVSDPNAFETYVVGTASGANRSFQARVNDGGANTGGPDAIGAGFPPDQWNCVIVTLDSQAGTGKVYRGDTDVSAGWAADTGFSGAFNGLPFFVGGDGGGGTTGDFADIRIMPGVSLLTTGDISEATRRLFIDAGGKPVNPAVATAALGAPCILFSGNAAAFPTNQGTGGAFTLTGSLTNASSSPSD